MLAIGQKGALLLAREGGELVGGLLHGADVAFPGVAHDANEKVEEKTLALVVAHGAFGGEQIAMGEVGRAASGVGGQPVALLQCAGEGVGLDGSDVEPLGARKDRAEDQVWRVGDHEDHGACRGLFDELEQLVGACGVHALGHPDDQHAVLGLVDPEARLADHLVALLGVD